MNPLTVRHLQFSHGNSFRLELDVLEVHPGEVQALIGPNGGGKSTLLQLLSGNLAPSRGVVNWNGRNLTSISRADLARSLAFLPQHLSPQFPMTVLELVLMGRHPHMHGLGLPEASDWTIARRSLERMSIGEFCDRDFSTLSGGERQRVLLASILAQEPKVILLDEPTTALDFHHQVRLLRLLKEESRRGTAILFSTHDLTLAAHFADRVTLLDHGKRIITGSVSEVFQEKHLEPVYGSEIRLIHPTPSDIPRIVPHISADDEREMRNPIPVVPEAENPPPPSSLRLSRLVSTWSVFALAALIVLFLAPAFGAESIHLPSALRDLWFRSSHEQGVAAQILQLRLPRVFLGLLAGMALGGAGAAFQCLLRNPLAEPYTLGIASTSSLGAVLAISFPILSPAWKIFSGVQIWALLFALMSVAFLWKIRRSSFAGRNMMGLLLAGVSLGLVSSAAILLVRFVASPLLLRAMDQWMVGGLEGSSWTEVTTCLPFLVIGLVLLVGHCRDLNQIAFSEEVARSRGVNVARVQKRVFLGGSLVTAAIVSVAGPIGFVGLLVPHIVRQLVGTDQRLVIPCSMFGAGALLMMADACARCLSVGGRGAEMPVGILTSLVGGIGFLILLLRRPQPG